MNAHWLLLGCVAVAAGCPTKDFLPCVVQLSSQGVPFDTNINNVIYNISTEAKLMHTCKTYEKVLPCFEQRVSSCGTKAQRIQLERAKRLHSYLCAPFSLQRQKIFLKQSQCIQNVLRKPMSSKCDKKGTIFAKKLDSCRSFCEPKDAMCRAKIEISELCTCTFLMVEKDCSSEAAQFFAQMQQVLTNKEYPIQCHYAQPSLSLSSRQAKKGLPAEPLAVNPPTPVPFQEPLITVTTHTTEQETRSHVPEVRRAEQRMNLANPPVISVRTAPLPSVADNLDATLKRAPVLNNIVHVHNHTNLLQGPRPIPETTLFVPATNSKFMPNPYATQSTRSFTFVQPTTSRPQEKASQHQDSPQDWQYIPWPNQNGQKSTLVNTFAYPTLLATTSSYEEVKAMDTAIDKPPFKFSPTSPQNPFKIEINWMNDAEVEKPWYQQTTPTVREEPTQASNDHFSAVEPIINQLRSNSLNFTELGNQANSYFSAALNAFTETKASVAHSDPWRTIIDAVAPTIQKVSPEIIPRIREEIDRIQPPN